MSKCEACGSEADVEVLHSRCSTRLCEGCDRAFRTSEAAMRPWVERQFADWLRTKQLERLNSQSTKGGGR